MCSKDIYTSDCYLLELKNKLNISVQELGLSKEVEGILINNGVYTLFQIIKMSYLDIYQLNGMGYERVAETMICVSNYLKSIQFQSLNQRLVKKAKRSEKEKRIIKRVKKAFANVRETCEFVRNDKFSHHCYPKLWDCSAVENICSRCDAIHICGQDILNCTEVFFDTLFGEIFYIPDIVGNSFLARRLRCISSDSRVDWVALLPSNLIDSLKYHLEKYGVKQHLINECHSFLFVAFSSKTKKGYMGLVNKIFTKNEKEKLLSRVKFIEQIRSSESELQVARENLTSRWKEFDFHSLDVFDIEDESFADDSLCDDMDQEESSSFDSYIPQHEIVTPIVDDSLNISNNIPHNCGENNSIKHAVTLRHVLTLRIDEMNFSVRTYNCLIRAKIYTAMDLIKHTEKEIKEIRNINQKCVEEIIEKIDQIGLTLNS